MWFQRKDHPSTLPPLVVQPLACLLCGSADIEERRAPFRHQLSDGPVIVPRDWHIWCQCCRTASHPGVMFPASLDALLQTLRDTNRAHHPARPKVQRHRHRMGEQAARAALAWSEATWRRWASAFPSEGRHALIRSVFGAGG